MHFYQDKSPQLPCILVYNSLYKPHTLLPFWGLCHLPRGFRARVWCNQSWIPKNHPHWLKTSSGIHGRWQEIPVVESPSIRDLAVSGLSMSFFGCDTMMAEIKSTRNPKHWLFKVSVDGLSVESWIQRWIHCLLWCNFSFLNTNKMNMLDGKTLKLRDFCPPGIPQLSWHSKMRSKWRPQWFASLPTSNPGSLENSLWKCVCKPVSNHMYQLLFVQKRHLVGCYSPPQVKSHVFFFNDLLSYPALFCYIKLYLILPD